MTINTNQDVIETQPPLQSYNKHWCICCEGAGNVDEVRYRYEYTGVSFVVIGEKHCPGCDGTGISFRAEIEREKDLV